MTLEEQPTQDNREQEQQLQDQQQQQSEQQQQQQQQPHGRIATAIRNAKITKRFKITAAGTTTPSGDEPKTSIASEKQPDEDMETTSVIFKSKYRPRQNFGGTSSSTTANSYTLNPTASNVYTTRPPQHSGTASSDDHPNSR
uniref:Uncharacterized protein n=1 Tax=Musca domestica TaxID=7370 RepID=A0A1I8NJ59_MUSDO